MALIRWQPFQEINTLHRQMDRMLDEMTGWSQEERVTWKPAIELQDTGETVILRVEIPGIEGKDLDVRVTREAVAIAGNHRYEKKTQENGAFRSEFRYGKFQRVIPLPVAIQNDRVKADFTNGILTLTLPKLEVARVVKVNVVNVSDPAAKMEAANEQPVETETDDLWESQPTESAAA